MTSPARVLVVDDDATLRGVVVRLLTKAGYQVLAAATGAEGLALWRSEGADVVLTDIQMPGMNGIEVVLVLRAQAPGLPIIAMSGGDRSKDLDLLGDARLLGAVGLLTKPFRAVDLYRAVDDALTSRRSEDTAS